MNTQEEIDNIDNYDQLYQFNNLLEKLTKLSDLTAIVYVYDKLKAQINSIPDSTFIIISQVHHKNQPNNNKLRIPISNKKTLKPLRRIHKIVKGYQTRKNYNKALEHTEKVKNIMINISKPPNQRHKLAKEIQKQINIPIKDILYIITHLKRTKCLDKYLVRKSPNQDIRRYFKEVGTL